MMDADWGSLNRFNNKDYREGYELRYQEAKAKYKKKIKKLKEKIEYLQKQIPLDESLFNFGSTESNSPVTKNWNCDGTCIERITDLATGKTTKVGRTTKI